jgi:hypothetical protein
MYMQKYILLLSIVQYSHNQHVHLQYIIRLPVSVQRTVIRPMTENYEKLHTFGKRKNSRCFYNSIYKMYTNI